MARSRGVTCLWCARPHATNPARGAPDPRRTRCQRGGLATPLAPSSSPQPTAPASGPGARSCTRHIICRCRHRGLVGGRPAASAPGCRWAAQHTAGQALRRPSRPLAARRPGRRHSLALVCNNVRYHASAREQLVRPPPSPTVVTGSYGSSAHALRLARVRLVVEAGGRCGRRRWPSSPLCISSWDADTIGRMTTDDCGTTANQDRTAQVRIASREERSSPCRNWYVDTLPVCAAVELPPNGIN